MSRQINQPVQSIKLTNVATVRLTVNGKRFEVACYKNKVLDYRAGLETDLSEVLQTSNIHVFTNVGKGQFAAVADLKEAFGEHATQEGIAIHILQRGKSLQVSEAERSQLYENQLTQIATWIASNCINPKTGNAYTASQIKYALTSTQEQQPEHLTSTKKNRNKKPRQPNTKEVQQEIRINVPQFTVQPHKPIKQQYLSALKYLQAADILPIQRAAMQLLWQFSASQEAAVLHALHALQIQPDIGTIANTAAAISSQDDHIGVKVLTLTVDPALYRPLQESAASTVTGSHLEIIQQQVFQTVLPTQVPTTKIEVKNGSFQDLRVDKSGSIIAENINNEDEDQQEDNENNNDVVSFSKKSIKAQKKKQQKEDRRTQHQPTTSKDDENDNSATMKQDLSTEHMPNTLAPVVKSASGVQTCNTCVGSANVYSTQAEYRAHFRSDWHRFNQKLKLQGVAAVSLQEFQQCDAESFFVTELENKK